MEEHFYSFAVFVVIVARATFASEAFVFFHLLQEWQFFSKSSYCIIFGSIAATAAAEVIVSLLA